MTMSKRKIKKSVRILAANLLRNYETGRLSDYLTDKELEQFDLERNNLADKLSDVVLRSPEDIIDYVILYD